MAFTAFVPSCVVVVSFQPIVRMCWNNGCRENSLDRSMHFEVDYDSIPQETTYLVICSLFPSPGCLILGDPNYDIKSNGKVKLVKMWTPCVQARLEQFVATLSRRNEMTDKVKCAAKTVICLSFFLSHDVDGGLKLQELEWCPGCLSVRW